MQLMWTDQARRRAEAEEARELRRAERQAQATLRAQRQQEVRASLQRYLCLFVSSTSHLLHLKISDKTIPPHPTCTVLLNH